MKNKKLLALLCTALAIGMLTAGCSGQKNAPELPDNPTQSENGSDPVTSAAAELGSLKSFTAQTLDGGSFTQDDIAGKDATIINYWSLLCGPCIDEMPAIAAFEKALPENVRLVTVCLDGADDEEYVKSILSEAGYDGITLLGGDGDYLGIWNNIQYTPTTVIADAEGNLAGDAIIGGQTDLSGTLLAAVNDVLKASGKAEISLEA